MCVCVCVCGRGGGVVEVQLSNSERPVRLLYVCKASAVGKISELPTKRLRVQSLVWLKVELLETFFCHTVRGQGR